MKFPEKHTWESSYNKISFYKCFHTGYFLWNTTFTPQAINVIRNQHTALIVSKYYGVTKWVSTLSFTFYHMQKQIEKFLYGVE